MGVGQGRTQPIRDLCTRGRASGKLAYAFECETKRPWGDMPPPATELFDIVFHFERVSLTSSAKHWTISQVWPRLVQERIGSVGLRGGRDWAAGIVSSENSR